MCNHRVQARFKDGSKDDNCHCICDVEKGTIQLRSTKSQVHLTSLRRESVVHRVVTKIEGDIHHNDHRNGGKGLTGILCSKAHLLLEFLHPGAVDIGDLRNAVWSKLETGSCMSMYVCMYECMYV